MKRSVIETIMGGLVLLVAVTFLVVAYSSSDLQRVEGYEVTARFNRIDGLADGSDVRMSGIKIGTVVGQELDPKTYLAIVHISLSDKIKLPTDSTAKIQSDGLLGSNYLALEPGAEEAMIQPGGEIRFTQDPVNLADLVGRFIFNAGGSPQKPPGAGPAEPPSAAATPPDQQKTVQ